MKLLLVQNRLYKDFSELYSFEKVIEFEQIQHEKSSVEQNLEFDYLSNEIRKFEGKVDGIVLSNWLTSDKEKEGDIFHSAFQLAIYIRLENNDVKSLPILILSKLSEKQILVHSKDTPHILVASFGTKILNPDNIVWEAMESDDFSFDDNETNSLEKIFDTSKEEIKREYHNIKSKIYIVDNSTSGHDIANQWGAYRMAQVAGIEKEIDYIYPKTLFFKYLLSNIDISETFDYSKYVQFWEQDLKVLFIDDKYENGWQQCLEGVFRKRILKDGKSITIDSKGSWNESYLPDIKNDKYDLILLDYYLGKEKGIDILFEIKKANPVVPVIMFTASNKAWNMDELYEAGADGYYIKEHPDNAHDTNFSVENFKSFHETVEKCLKKGDLLRKYWSKINLIKHKWNFTNKGNQENKERIEERLTMFIGLLKKAYEQTKFDKKTFFYSDWELAFLTLWSTLNEIQEVYYEKTKFVFKDNHGNIVLTHSQRSEVPKPTMPEINEWRLRTFDSFNPEKPIFIQYDFEFKYSSNGNIEVKSGLFKFDLKNKSELFYSGKSTKPYTFNLKGVAPVNVKLEDTLHAQIAYIMLNMKAKSVLLTYLDNLNKERNHLYLTHGEATSSPNFIDLYQSQRKSDADWQTQIKELFEIVYFLCTGEECVL